MHEDDDEQREYDVDHSDVITHTVDYTPNVENSDPFSKDFDYAKSLSGISSNKKRSMTALRKRYENKSGTEGSKSIEDNVITGYNAFDVVLPPYNLDYLAKLYEKNVTHKAAVDAKTSNIVGLGYDFIPSYNAKKKLDKFEGDKAEKYQNKLTDWKQRLLDAVDDMNVEDTFKQVLEKAWKDYECTGNGYIEISRSAATGEIKYIGHVPATTIRVRRDRDGFIQIIANKAVFFRNFGGDDPNPLKGDDNPNEIIHLKKYAPSNTFYGIPDIIPASGAVAGNNFAEQFNLDYFENKAVPRHIVVLKGATINPRLAKNILEFFETGLKGKNHRSLFIPLPASTNERKIEFEFKPVEAGIQDSSFTKYRKDNRDDILMAHRVFINKVGLAEGVSLAVARDADKTFKEQVCGPEQDTLEHKVNKIFKDIQGSQHLFDFKLNELTLTDENTQSQIDERRIKTGQETPNEQRVRRGMPSHKKGDELFDINAKAKQAGAARTEATTTRQRDSARSASRTDSQGEGRNPKGEGRTNGTG